MESGAGLDEIRAASKPRLSAGRLSLTWRFAIAALVVVVLVGYVQAKLLGGVIADHARADQESGARDMITRRVLPQLTPRDLDEPMTGQRLEEFDRFVQANVVSSRTARIKVWDKTGRVIYSDNYDEIGRQFPIDGQREAAFNGKTVSAIDTPSEAETDSDGQLGALLEVYAPIVFPGSHDVAGAFEIYQVYGPVAAQVADTQRYVVLGLAGADW